jgi:hypothetical protein
MYRFHAIALLFFVITPCFADIYQWTDDNGVVHFSDNSFPGAKVLKLTTNVMELGSFASPKSIPDLKKSLTESPNLKLESNPLIIRSPKQQETIRNNQGEVSVMVESNLNETKGYTMRLVLDGKPVDNLPFHNHFVLSHLDRGRHTLAAQILDNHNVVRKTSEEIMFYMQRPRIKQLSAKKKLPS